MGVGRRFWSFHFKCPACVDGLRHRKASQTKTTHRGPLPFPSNDSFTGRSEHLSLPLSTFARVLSTIGDALLSDCNFHECISNGWIPEWYQSVPRGTSRLVDYSWDRRNTFHLWETNWLFLSVGRQREPRLSSTWRSKTDSDAPSSSVLFKISNASCR